jgi:hypothetical protein
MMRFAEPRRQRSAPGSFVGGWLGKVLVAGFLFLNFLAGDSNPLWQKRSIGFKAECEVKKKINSFGRLYNKIGLEGGKQLRL